MNRDGGQKKGNKRKWAKHKKDSEKPIPVSPPKKYFFVLTILTCLATLLYLNSFEVPWQFDDRPNIVDNQTVHMRTLSLDHLLRLITYSYSESIRYFSYFTFALNYYFGGLHVFGYHLVNLLIHIATGIFLFWFILLTLNLPSQRERYASIGLKVAFLTSLLFIAHPVQTQSVTYIVQRMTSMAAMFYLLSMIFYVKGRVSTGRKQLLYFCAMGLSGLLAFFSKENTFILPFFILFYEILFFQKWSKGFFHSSVIKIVIVLIGLGAMGFILLGDKYIPLIKEGYLYREFSMSERVLTQFRVVLHYVTLLIFPHPSRLNVDYDFSISRSLFNPISTFFSLLLILFFIGIGIWKMRKWPVLSFFIFWYFGNLVIESSIIPLEMVYEHRLYLPSIGPIFLFSLFLTRAWERRAPMEHPKKEVFFWGLVIFIALPLSWSTIERNAIWRSEFNLWSDCVKKSPLKGRPHYNLGYFFYRQKQTDKAKKEFEKAVALDPKLAPAHLNLGVIYYNKGLYDEAVRYFKNALTINPKYTQAYAYLGDAYLAMGDLDKTITEMEKALKVDPRNVRARLNLGEAYYQQGKFDQAVSEWKRVLEIHPEEGEAHHSLAIAYYTKKEYRLAIKHLDEAFALGVKIHPQLAEGLKPYR